MKKKMLLLQHAKLIYFRDPAVFPYVCTSIVPCQKLFKTEASEINHRRNKRCLKLKCSKCDQEVTNKIELSKHEAKCEEEMLANAAIDHHFTTLDKLDNITDTGLLKYILVNGIQMPIEL